MTQKEAIVEAIKRLGGKANLNDIYRFAYTLADFSGSKDWKATIRWYLQKKSDTFRSSKRGWWELVSFQEEIHTRDLRIAELEALLVDRDKEISELKQQETAELFVGRLIDATQTVFATKRNDARPVQQVLVVMNRPEQQELREWIIGKPTKVVNKTITKKIIQKTINRGNTYVDHQTILPNVGNYKPQITTQNIEVPMPPLGHQEEPKQLEDEQRR